MSLASDIAPMLHAPLLPTEGVCQAVLGAKGMIQLQVIPLEVFTLETALSMGEGKGLCMKKHAWHRVAKAIQADSEQIWSQSLFDGAAL